MSITGRRWTRRERVHPMWCDVARCLSPYAGTLGEHRSAPMVQAVPGYGRVVLTLAQLPGQAARLEVTISARVVPDADADGAAQRAYAHRLLDELGDAIARVGVYACAEAILSGAPARRAVGQ